MQRLTIEKIQRPRRTAEFHEEPGTADKRQTRAPRRAGSTEASPAHGLTQKNAIGLRTSAASSAKRARSFLPTPQKTPLESARVLFTAEKQRSTMVGAMHNDKKWIQDQTQRITEYLMKTWTPGGMSGIASDFFSRSNCLKQMSIKQFVSIINHFLHMIWGNRFAVGTNHVEDIVQILQKLNYPHQVNKSWLKTPNTTHSFGNVIVLFDFFMDFVLPPEFELPLSELEENNELEPDLEFKAELLRTCENSFNLWDRNLEDAFEKMERKLADMLVQKRCDVASLDALNAEVGRLSAYRDNLTSQHPKIAAEKEREREYERLRKLAKNAEIELEQLSERATKNDLKLEQISLKYRNSSTEYASLKESVETLRKIISAQQYNVKQRHECNEKLKELHLELQCHDRTVNELEKRDCRQQVQLSVTKQNTTREIENLNKILRDIAFSLGITQSDLHYEIPLNANSKDVERLLPAFRSFQDKFVKDLQNSKDDLDRMKNELVKLKNDIQVNEPRVKAQEKSRTILIQRLEQLQTQFNQDFEKIFFSLQNLNIELSLLQMELEQQEQLLLKKRDAIKQIESECEELMLKAEEEHNAAAEAREKDLNEKESNLEVCLSQLRELEEIVMRDEVLETIG